MLTTAKSIKNVVNWTELPGGPFNLQAMSVATAIALLVETLCPNHARVLTESQLRWIKEQVRKTRWDDEGAVRYVETRSGLVSHASIEIIQKMVCFALQVIIAHNNDWQKTCGFCSGCMSSMYVCMHHILYAVVFLLVKKKSAVNTSTPTCTAVRMLLPPPFQLRSKQYRNTSASVSKVSKT